MPMSKITEKKRKALSELSQIAKLMVKTGVCNSINKALIDIYKEQIPGIQELNTFWGWSHKGYKVKKGSVSVQIWGKPIEHQEEETNGENKSEDFSESETKKVFFPMCNLFSNLQVQLMPTKGKDN